MQLIFMLLLMGSTLDRTKYGLEDCLPTMIKLKYLVKLSTYILFSFHFYFGLLRSENELLFEFLLEIVLRSLSDMESSIKFSNYIRFFFSKTYFLIHMELTIVLP